MATVDVLKHALDREMKAYRNRDFATSLMAEISIRADDTSAKVIFGHARRIGYSSYHISQWGGQSSDMTVRSSSNRKAIISTSTRKRLHAFLDGVERFQNPLDDLEMPQEIRQARAWTAQQQWWEDNGMTFDLLRLPAELRDAIYAAVLPDVIHPYPYHSGRGLSRLDANELMLSQSLKPVLLNRQIRAEACNYYFTYSTFLVDDLKIWLDLIRNDYFVKNVKRLDLHFNVVCPPVKRNPAGRPFNRRSARVLEDVRFTLRSMTLRHLKIRLPPYRIRTPFINHPRNHRLASTKCRTRVNSGHLIKVFQQISGHSGVEVVRLLNTVQAAAFHRACKDAAIGFTTWKTNAITAGHMDQTLNEYDRWNRFFDSDSDGGVALGEAETDKQEVWDFRDVEPEMLCICPTVCYRIRQL